MFIIVKRASGLFESFHGQWAKCKIDATQAPLLSTMCRATIVAAWEPSLKHKILPCLRVVPRTHRHFYGAREEQKKHNAGSWDGTSYGGGKCREQTESASPKKAKTKPRRMREHLHFSAGLWGTKPRRNKEAQFTTARAWARRPGLPWTGSPFKVTIQYGQQTLPDRSATSK